MFTIEHTYIELCACMNMKRMCVPKHLWLKCDVLTGQVFSGTLEYIRDWNRKPNERINVTSQRGRAWNGQRREGGEKSMNKKYMEKKLKKLNTSYGDMIEKVWINVHIHTKAICSFMSCNENDSFATLRTISQHLLRYFATRWLSNKSDYVQWKAMFMFESNERTEREVEKKQHL